MLASLILSCRFFVRFVHWDYFKIVAKTRFQGNISLITFSIHLRFYGKRQKIRSLASGVRAA